MKKKILSKVIMALTLMLGIITVSVANFTNNKEVHPAEASCTKSYL